MFLAISVRAVEHRRRRLGLLPPGGKEFVRPKPWTPKEDALGLNIRQWIFAREGSAA
jgi:hypothetical protein